MNTIPKQLYRGRRESSDRLEPTSEQKKQTPGDKLTREPEQDEEYDLDRH